MATNANGQTRANLQQLLTQTRLAQNNLLLVALCYTLLGDNIQEMLDSGEPDVELLARVQRLSSGTIQLNIDSRNDNLLSLLNNWDSFVTAFRENGSQLFKVDGQYSPELAAKIYAAIGRINT